MSITLRIPFCPWCEQEMEWLAEETDFDSREDQCRHCNRTVLIGSKLVVTVTAKKVPHLKVVGES